MRVPWRGWFERSWTVVLEIIVEDMNEISNDQSPLAPLIVGGTLLLTVGLLLLPGDLVERLGAYGYLGVFLLTLLSSATIVLPSPALGVVALAGKTMNPWLVGLIGGLAAGLGESTGYIAGLGGSPLAERARFYSRVERWVRRWGALTIFTLAF